MHVARTCTKSVRHTALTFINATPFAIPRSKGLSPRPLSTCPKMSAASSSPTLASFSRLQFQSTFTDELPADPEPSNEPRQVQNAAYSKVVPTQPSADDIADAWAAALANGQVEMPPAGDPVLAKALVAWSPTCAALFDVPRDYPAGDDEAAIVDVLGGFGNLCPGMAPYAMCYGGHQFGNWAGQLGDGRAISLGEFVNGRADRWEVQLKGAGKTPYSRFADGRAVLRSSVREFLCSEAMHALGVPTTRALSLITTGAGVIRDMFYAGEPFMEAGAVVARVAPSFLRLGNFQLATSRKDVELLKATADYAIKWHFPQFKDLPTDPESEDGNRYIALVREIASRNARMVAWWQAVGFVHGVMNTDNFSILGLTIDYGPYGFLDAYDPEYTPNTTDIPGRRYKFSSQPTVAHWNIMQFAKSMLSLTGDNVVQVVSEFEGMFRDAHSEIMSKKLGLAEWQTDDEDLLNEFLDRMKECEADFTNTWRALSAISSSSSAADCRAWCEAQEVGKEGTRMESWTEWLQKYQSRLKLNQGKMSDDERITVMNSANPVYILRNYMAQTAIEMADKGDYSEVRHLYDLLQRPYEVQEGMEKYTSRPPQWASRKGVCVNSCSS